ncbi:MULTISPECIES: GerAB/ArcD/ProY family transporter [unclassified Paenibacillus]|uniref:GerAB/ArcD/ProY family transporter n=1 Tax=unclassified Paenibacillus TaxID=185978 RepID=UPI00020D7206|nr:MULTISPECIES: GerAB/ArcD/ProY family transporter [unclassified Paenibacillus]EGL18747.1 spore germination protein (amino acid permease) [Paenibacillus sp. HGF7]EPD92751.1 spore germination protein (amino acid permease) [Paenibacillus sp. HGH0039]
MDKITPLQTYMLFTQYLLSTLVSFLAAPLIQNAGYSVWIPVIAGSLLGGVLTYLAYKLGCRRPGRYMAEYGREIIGRPLHYLLVLFMAFVYLFTAALVLRQLTDFIVEIYLPGTPLWAVAGLLGLCTTRLVHSGVTNIFRSGQGVFFVALALVVLIAVASCQDIVPYSVVSLVTNFDGRGIFSATAMITGLFGEMTFIALFFPKFKETGRTMKALVWAIVTAAVLTLGNLIPMVLLFGPSLAANLTYANLEMTRYIQLGNFIQNMDPILILMWLFTLLVKISLFLYISVIAVTQTLKMKDTRPLTLPFGVTVVFLCLWMVNSSETLDRFAGTAEVPMMLLAELIPVVYLLVDALRSRFKKRQPVREPST